MNNKIKRAIVAVIILVIVYFVGDIFLVSAPAYDAVVKAIEFLAAVVAAGCYWIGSNERN